MVWSACNLMVIVVDTKRKCWGKSHVFLP